MKPRLVAAFLVVGLVPLGAFGAIILTNVTGEIAAQSSQKLVAVRQNKKERLERYFDTARDQAIAHAADRMVIEAMREFATAFTFNKTGDPEALKPELLSFYTDQFAPTYAARNEGAAVDVESLFGALDAESIALQHDYIHLNPNPIGEKYKLDRSDSASIYNRIHEKYHHSMRIFMEKFGYSDIMLIDHETGDIVYSVAKELDFTTSLIDGPYADTNLGEAFRTARELEPGDSFAFADFRQYLPSYNDPASFIAVPIYGGDTMLGVLAFQIPIDRVNDIMAERAGLGETGDTYVIGPDHLMRSDAYRDPEHRSVVASFRHPEAGKVETAAATAALGGEAGVGTITDYAGHEVLSAYAPVDILGVKWAMLAEIDEAEAMAAVASMERLIAIVGLAAAVSIIVLGYLVARGLARPIVSMTGAMGRLAAGDLSTEVPALDRHDEIGQMAAAVEVFKTNAIEMARLEEEQKNIEAKAAEERKRILHQMAADFESSVGGIVGIVASAAAEMRTASEAMSRTADGTKDQSMAVASASEQASANVQTVASAAEELASSIAEISQQVARSADTAERAVAEANRTDGRVRGLAEAVGKIGEIVKLITDIADQTNLLALNATIEAARAGDAGKGFAVVASEVKQLAAQTARATQEISAQIAAIQTSTADAVTAIEQISATIAETSQIATSISAAVEEQSAATDEIARNVDQAAVGTRDVSAAIAKVSEDASATGAAAEEITSSVGALSEQAERLRAEVAQFLTTVRAA